MSLLKPNLQLSTASLGGLQYLKYNAFTMSGIGASKYVPIAQPSFVVGFLTCAPPTGYQASCQTFKLTLPANATLPSWCIPGVPVAINVTINGMTYIWTPIVGSIDTANGTFLTFNNAAQQQSVITQAFSNQALDSISGTVVNSVTLCTQCQKAMLQVPAGSPSVNISPTADVNGANPGYVTTLTAGGGEYELLMPTGSKFDISDWYVQAASAGGSLNIRIL